MTEASYVVVFQGDILAGFERGEVMQRFRELFGLPAEDVDRIFRHPRVVLKRNLGRAAADAYRSRLAGIGMAVSLDAIRSTPAAPQAAAPVTPPPPALALAAEAAAAPQAAAHEAMPRVEPTSRPPAAAGSAMGMAGAAPDTDERRELSFEFLGNGAEFFRIWIVNVLLGIVTLGIYSAWAKVRTQRYFYGNTRLDGASFEYLADPLKILKGRLIAFVLLGAYTAAEKFSPLLAGVLMLGLLAIFPWVMVRALAFRNHNSAWRGVRFGFDGQVAEAYKVFLLWPLAGVLSLGLLFPYATWRQQRFIIDNSRYGVEHFTFEARPGRFYRIALTLLGVAVGGGIATALLSMASPLLGPLGMVATYLAAFALGNVLATNLRFNHTMLGPHFLRASYTLGSYARLMVTNTLATALTLGLFYPWAKVRSARYAAQHIGVDAEGDLGAFAAGQREEVSALGGEIGDLFDMDIGL